jgi:hypothetical protein
MRRMIELEAHLTEEVLPDLPLRQFVFTVPFALRYRIAFDPDLCAAVRRVLVRAIIGFHRERSRRIGFPRGSGERWSPRSASGRP